MTYDDARAILTSCTHTDKPGSEYGSDKTASGWACTDCWNAHVMAWRQVRKAQLQERPNDCQRCGARPHTFIYGPYRLCGRCKTATSREHNKAMAAAGGLGIFATNPLVNTIDWHARREQAVMKTETKHTPGPWRTRQYSAGEQAIMIESERAYALADVYGGNGYYPMEANARLIAAAPELLSAAKASIARIKGIFDDSDLQKFGPLKYSDREDVIDILEAAIAKAEGK